MDTGSSFSPNTDGIDVSSLRKDQEVESYVQEKKWFSTSYEEIQGPCKPSNSTFHENHFQMYQLAIWYNDLHTVIPEYGSTPAELARLCGQGPDGWLCTSHMVWFLHRLNLQQDETLCFCLNATSADYKMRQLMLSRNLKENTKQLVFIVNVGKNQDNSVYLGTNHKSGSHWVLVVLKLQPVTTIYYCDSLAWELPEGLLKELAKFTIFLGITSLHRNMVILCHKPTPLGFDHVCTSTCTQYPLQTCSNVCGVIAVVCSAVATLDQKLFNYLTSPHSKSTIYLCHPTNHERYLRRVLITWLMTGTIDMKMISLIQYPETGIDHTYSVNVSYAKRRRAKLSRKRNTHSTLSAINGVVNTSKLTKDALDDQHMVVDEHIQDTVLLTDIPNANLFVPTPSATLFDPSTCTTQTTNVTPCNNNIPQPVPPPEPVSKYQCPECLITLSCRQARSRHIKRKHGNIDIQPTANVSCHECENFRCRTIKELIAHYNTCHGKKFDIQVKEFKDENEFQEWVKQTERENCSWFVNPYGQNTYVGHTTCYYYWNRTGNFEGKGVGKRSLKSQGSSKIDGKCCAFITKKTNKSNGHIAVEYCLNHVGHDPQLSHLRLSDEIRTMIVGKLATGVNPTTLLDDIRDKIVNINRDSMVTRKDILNIKQQYNISNVERDSNDATSVGIWVQELEAQAFNPIIIYKPQGIISHGLEKDDFLIGIQTEFQRDMMVKFVEKMVCVDSTHSTNQYDFLLTTILVIDDFGEALPVAWAISNREDSEVLRPFMLALKERGGNYHTKLFMSDLANNFYNAWVETFSTPDKKVYCSWHVDKSWRKNIRSRIKDTKTQSEVYAFLKMLQYEVDECKFRRMMQEMLVVLEEKCPEFKEYFSDNYVIGNKTLMWAACFRIGTCANTNMYAEAFHRVLKDLYFNRKQNRRVDNLIVVLLKVSSDKAIEQFIKEERGKNTYRIREMKKRHKFSEAITNITCVVENEEWHVPSISTNGLHHVVRKNVTEECSCKVICDVCLICIHTYSCSCIDFLMHAVACKHIHATHMKFNRTSTKHQCDRTEHEQSMADQDYFSRIICNENPIGSVNVERVRSALTAKVDELLKVIKDAPNVDTLRGISRHLDATISVGKGLHTIGIDHDYERKTMYNSNKKFETQRRLFSTRTSKKQCNPSTLKLPSTTKKNKLMESLSNVIPQVCSMCFMENDQLQTETVQWLECSSCSSWVHLNCDVLHDASGEYNCILCRK